MERSRARSSWASGTLGRPSGKRSPVQALVYSIIWSLVQDHNCAGAGAGARVINTAQASRRAQPWEIPRIVIFYLAPLAIVGAIDIPLRGRLTEAGFRKVLLHCFVVERDPQAGLIRHADEALVDDGLFAAFDQGVPPWDVYRVILHHQALFG